MVDKSENVDENKPILANSSIDVSIAKYSTVQKISHQKWRAQLKKQKRKEKRRLIALGGEAQNFISVNNSTCPNVSCTESSEQPCSPQDDDDEDEEEKQREFYRQQDHEQWLEREKLAQLEFLAKKEREENERFRKLEEERRIKEEWEERERQEAERKKEEKKIKEKQEELLRQATTFVKKWDTSSVAGDDAWHNPLAPPSYNPDGPDQAPRPPCPFFSKVGACRFADRCSRTHDVPDTSCTLLFPGMYLNFGLQETHRDEFDSDMTLEYEDSDLYQHFEQFYADVLPEFKTIGRVTQFKVCCNHEPHLRGNVYVQFHTQAEAHAAHAKFNGRWYAGKQLSCHMTCVSNWKSAVCGLFHRKRCPKGRHCNFLHVFPNPRNEFWEMDRGIVRGDEREDSMRGSTRRGTRGEEERSERRERRNEEGRGASGDEGRSDQRQWGRRSPDRYHRWTSRWSLRREDVREQREHVRRRSKRSRSGSGAKDGENTGKRLRSRTKDAKSTRRESTRRRSQLKEGESTRHSRSRERESIRSRSYSGTPGKDNSRSESKSPLNERIHGKRQRSRSNERYTRDSVRRNRSRSNDMGRRRRSRSNERKIRRCWSKSGERGRRTRSRSRSYRRKRDRSDERSNGSMSDERKPRDRSRSLENQQRDLSKTDVRKRMHSGSDSSRDMSRSNTPNRKKKRSVSKTDKNRSSARVKGEQPTNDTQQHSIDWNDKENKDTKHTENSHPTLQEASTVTEVIEANKGVTKDKKQLLENETNEKELKKKKKAKKKHRKKRSPSTAQEDTDESSNSEQSQLRLERKNKRRRKKSETGDSPIRVTSKSTLKEKTTRNDKENNDSDEEFFTPRLQDDHKKEDMAIDMSRTSPEKMGALDESHTSPAKNLQTKLVLDDSRTSLKNEHKLGVLRTKHKKRKKKKQMKCNSSQSSDEISKGNSAEKGRPKCTTVADRIEIDKEITVVGAVEITACEAVEEVMTNAAECEFTELTTI